ncbi:MULTISPECIES: transcriptional regulator TbsP [Haloarcula]|uniref:Transcriptional regulator n=1 Tax=Haloarcula pellucida TaxID=1427151 RepID=A0A830GKD1_9EURY|nr:MULTISPECIES: DUF5821 family protein [Halomicroarcula]MBX0347698.1 hypothetical protein [Halomicroarcula pellucida]MDS0276369.1 DUF5821 family protein [Halomicroarcula sp. S1AR25-4]GGN89913.1 hypothetical protein GCM10009030_11230 [Halomicroarcula pellucida]
MSATLLNDDVGAMLSSVFDDADDPIYVVNPDRDTISALVTTLDEQTEPPEVRLLADERALKDVMDDFLVASTAADLVESGDLTMRLLAHVPTHSVAVTADSVFALVTIGDAVGGLGTDDSEFVDGAYEYYETTWEGAEAYSLRTPPITTVRSTLESEIGEATAADFDSVLGSLTTARGDGDGLDEVTISLLVAARNGELLYDISKWGEDVGLASKATFSRTKTKLEDMGLIDTEKVPIDVGRPRLRLMLGDERLESADADELATVAQSLLAA